jgi:cytochrome c peroxidase
MGQKSDLFVFRTPGLRDLARTPPYMHDGSFETLSNVVEFYYRGVPRQLPDGSAPDLEPLSSQS